MMPVAEAEGALIVIPDENALIAGGTAQASAVIATRDDWGMLLDQQRNELQRLGHAPAPEWQVLIGRVLAGLPSTWNVDNGYFLDLQGQDSPITRLLTTLPVNYETPKGPALLTELPVDPVIDYRRAREETRQSLDDAVVDLKRQLDTRTAWYGRKLLRDVVIELNEEAGLNQLTMARAVGVTSAAVRKWRRGESARSELRSQLFRLAALLDLLADAGVKEPAGWIDVPISSDSTLTPLNLFAAGRADLVLLFANDLSGPQDVLDDYDADWRSHFARDGEYEVVTLADGSRSVVPRIGNTL